MTRLLAWCTGASIGAVVGFLAGTVVRDRADFRESRQRALMMGATPAERARARQVPPIRRASAPVRPVETRTAPGGTSGRPEPSAALCGVPDLWDGRRCTRPIGHDGDHTDGPTAAWWTSTPREDA